MKKKIEQLLEKAKRPPKELSAANIKLAPWWFPLDHLVRYEWTFHHLRQRVSASSELVLDLGSNPAYHPELKDIFPTAKFMFCGTHDAPDWFSLDLEKDPLPLDNDKVDVVLLLEVVEHFYEDPMFCLSEINRVLKPGGLLLMTTPNIVSLRGTFTTLLGKEPYFAMKYERYRGARRHVHEYAPYQLEELAAAAGFDVELWTENVYSNDMPELLSFLDLLGLPTQNRGDTLFCVGKKTGPVVDRYPPLLYEKGHD